MLDSLVNWNLTQENNRNTLETEKIFIFPVHLNYKNVASTVWSVVFSCLFLKQVTLSKEKKLPEKF